MPELLKAVEVMKALGAKRADITIWKQGGAPCRIKYFPPRGGPSGTAGGGGRADGWDLEELREWLLERGILDDAGNIKSMSPRQIRAADADLNQTTPPENRSTPGLVRLALAHLLGAFAFAGQSGGIPHALQEMLEDAGIEELSGEALRIVEAAAAGNTKTDSQWLIIKQAIFQIEPQAVGAGTPPAWDGERQELLAQIKELGERLAREKAKRAEGSRVEPDPFSLKSPSVAEPEPEPEPGKVQVETKAGGPGVNIEIHYHYGEQEKK